MSDGWIRWRGGACPVAAGTLIDIRDRDGYVWKNIPALSGYTNNAEMWAGEDVFPSNNVAAYRLVVDAPEPVPAPSPANDNLTPRAKFDASSPLQEDLAINISAQICNGVRPDEVQVLEWAAALYEAEVGAA